MTASTASTASTIEKELRALGTVEREQVSRRFFKTGPGEYGEGDEFIGVRVPQLRALGKKFRAIPVDQAVKLLQSRYHESRLVALILLVYRYERGSAELKQEIFDAYLANTSKVNSWDLVDSSAPQIVGAHLFYGSRAILTKLAKSPMLWERRIAIIATLQFIRNGDFADTLRIAELLLKDREDLIHKAVGWMIREVANGDQPAAEAFLQQHYREMPRTMLRYAIEKFTPDRRRMYMLTEQ